jgi:hypothetical protein
VLSASPTRCAAPPTPSTADTPSRSESAWWSALAYALHASSVEQETLAKKLVPTKLQEDGIVNKFQHLQMEQSHLNKQLNDETQAVLKKKEDAIAALKQAKKNQKAAQNSVERLLNTVHESTKNTDNKTLNKLFNKMGVSRDVNEERATESSKKLFKRLQECEQEVRERSERKKNVPVGVLLWAPAARFPDTRVLLTPNLLARRFGTPSSTCRT